MDADFWTGVVADSRTEVVARAEVVVRRDSSDIGTAAGVSSGGKEDMVLKVDDGAMVELRWALAPPLTLLQFGGTFISHLEWQL